MNGNEKLLWLFRQALSLFPGSFRCEFADEMIEVVRQASEQASAQGWLAWLLFWQREFIALPACLAREHWLAFIQPEAKMSVQAAVPGGGDQSLPPNGVFSPVLPRDLFLAALPHLLVGLLLSLEESGVLQNLLPEGSPLARPLVILFWLCAGGGLLWAFISARRAGWPGWSGAWMTYLGLACFSGIIVLVSIVNIEDWLNRYNIFFFVIAAVVAFALYRLTRANALHGLLAGLTVVALTGLQALEFVPPAIQAGVVACGWLALAATTVLVMRFGAAAKGYPPRLRWSLPIALLGSLAILTPFAWVGIYHGGMLYFDAPGPSWVQVARAGLPMFGVAACLLLGPQLARQVRQLDLDRKAAFLWRYRLALLGELSLLAGVVVIFWQHTNDDVSKIAWPALSFLAAGFLFLGLGMGLVVWTARRLPGRTWAYGLFLALLGLPWALLASLPGPLENFAYTTHRFPLVLTHYPEFGLHLSALLWALLAAWVILSGERSLSSGSLPEKPQGSRL